MPTALHRAVLTALGAASLVAAPAPALAQADRAIVMNILRECTKIADAGARMACFDNNIRIAGPAPSGSEDPAATRRDIVMNILMECARIDDEPARMACYDNNMRTGSASLATSAQAQAAPAAAPVAADQRNTDPETAAVRGPRTAAIQGEAGPLPGFGGASSTARLITPTVAAVSEQVPGAFLLTLRDGTQWEYLEDLPPTYKAPERGSTVTIEKGAFGSFRLRFDRQQPVRVRRVR